jgi:hypothetical protein
VENVAADEQAIETEGGFKQAGGSSGDRVLGCLHCLSPASLNQLPIGKLLTGVLPHFVALVNRCAAGLESGQWLGVVLHFQPKLLVALQPTHEISF